MDVAERDTYDYIVIGSGFGGSISAMRLAEKGYTVLVLERGRRFRDADFPKSDWNLPRHQWLPALRCFGIWQNTLLNGIMILHGSGVGGGSLVYANVLMEPDDKLFSAAAWRHLTDWKSVLRPHYATARRMLGVTPNPRLHPADDLLREAAREIGKEATCRPTEVGVFFNEEKPGEVVADPYFGGEGPERKGCEHCGACMVGCRENAKNTLEKNYLFFAEKWGVEIRPEATVTEIGPVSDPRTYGVRYETRYFETRGWLRKPFHRVYSRNVIIAAGAVNTIRLLLRCRDITGSLPRISTHLGSNVRTNSESLTGVTSKDRKKDFSKGVAIGSIFQADDETQMEAVRFPEGSGLMLKMLGAPMLDLRGSGFVPFVKKVWQIIRYPFMFLLLRLLPGVAPRATVLLTMQTTDNLMRVKLGRGFFTLFRRDLICEHDQDNPIRAGLEIAHRVTRIMAEKAGGFASSMINESLLNIPGTAHFMGGVPFGRSDADGVIGLNCEVHNYPGLHVVDGSIIPANPGVNPTLTIAALAEYAMDQIPPKPGARVRPPLMKERETR